jgi:NADPH:quinone reductase-like Zn-dependent oxidoreductase
MGAEQKRGDHQMKSMVLDGVEQPLVMKELPDLAAGDGETVVTLKAAALNHRDVWIQAGKYAGLKFPIILGSDGSGVLANGSAVIINPSLDWGTQQRGFGPAFRILGLPNDGTFAQQVKVPSVNIAPKPAHLTHEQAAALPLAGLTAYRALFSRSNLQAGERVLITGIGAGTAQFALQFALAAGAQVHVTSGSDEKIAQAKALGAQGGANYTDPNWVQTLTAVGGFDVIIDSAGGDGFLQLIELAATGGRIAFFGATQGNPSKFELRRVFWKQVSLLGTTMGSPKDFADMTDFVARHKITPIVDQVVPLADANHAMQRMAKGQQTGKLVLSI